MNLALRMAREIPVWPEQRSMAEVARRSGVAMGHWLISCFPMEAPLCEDDDGKISWPSEEDKLKWMGILSRSTRTGRQRAVTAYWKGKWHGDYKSCGEAARQCGVSRPSVTKSATEKCDVMGWRFEYV